jgi:hypothetical protein
MEELRDFLTYLKSTPYEGHQEQCGRGLNYWNADYWTIEVTRCLLFGNDYVLSNKFENNKNADPNRIKKDSNIKLLMKKNLETVNNDSDFLLICEVGRGLDVLIANNVKKWKKIYCYDHVDYGSHLSIFDNVEFFHEGTNVFNPDKIPNDLIMIVNHSLYKPYKNKNIIHAIIDGELKW